VSLTFPAACDVLRCSLDAAEGIEPLWPHASLAHLLDLAEPVTLRSFACGFEFHLSPRDGDVAFGMCVERGAASDLIASAATEWWRKVIRHWTLSEGGPWARIRYVCIEIDRPGHASDGAEGPAPWATAFPFFAVSEAISAHGGFAVLEEVFGALVPAATAQDTEALLTGLPRDARILHLTALAHRGCLEFRAQGTAATRAVCEWLTERLGSDSPGTQILRHLLDGLPVGALAVQARSTSGVVRPYAVEITLPCGVHGGPIWRALLERAVQIGLASPERVSALQAWPGHSTHAFSGGPCPVRIDRSFHVTLRVDGDPVLKGYAHSYPRYVLS
jgi:hypothetical protein